MTKVPPKPPHPGIELRYLFAEMDSLNIEKLAKMIGMCVGDLTQVFNGDKSIDDYFVSKIKKILGNVEATKLLQKQKEYDEYEIKIYLTEQERMLSKHSRDI